MTREEIIAFFERRNERWRQRDIAALTLDYAPDALVQSPTASYQQGREAIESVLRIWLNAFPDIEYQTEDLIIDGSRVVQIARIVGTHRGEFFGLAPTGRRFDATTVHIYTLADNQITHERRILDFTGVLLQVGVLRAKPAL